MFTKWWQEMYSIPKHTFYSVRAHDKRRFQPGASIHLEMGGGGQSASEENRPIVTDTWSRGPQGWTGPLAGVARGRCPLPKKISYFMGIK